MSKARDTVPEIRPAGRVFYTAAGGIAGELSQLQVPDTPKNVQPFRKSFYARVGQAGRHFGFRNDPLPPDVRFGRKGEYCESAESCLRAQTSTDGLNAIAAENAEKKYRRNRKEPLGKGPEMNCTLPGKYNRPNFAFGIASDKCESAKSIIYASGTEGDTMSPSRKDPGVQKHRRYDWAGVNIDPTKYRFGCSSQASNVAIKELFVPQSNTSVMPLKVAQNKSVSVIGALGTTRNLGFGTRKQGMDFMYGKTMTGADKMTAASLLAGGGTQGDVNDTDMGRPVCKSATLRHLRLQDKPHDINRVFGVPTVRTDLPKPKSRKVTAGQNYGDDANAAALLYPPPHDAPVEVFMNPLPLDEMKSLLTQCDYGLSEDQISKVYSACQLQSGGHVCLEQFRKMEQKLNLS